MDPINVLVWIIIGGVAGLITSLLVREISLRVVAADVAVGILGGLAGGYILRMLNVIGDVDLTTLNAPSAVIAMVGAVVLLLAFELIRSSQQR